ncbi:hypothetical protein JXM83_05890 [Candidatus Woesearchaeota archaeon]|nr:hypothetical protein [Candidatus Woesearchaeota archaeon]
MKKENRIITIGLFTLLLIYFFYQHTKGIFWDFCAYELNARYWLGQTQYFEFFRPPLTQILLTFIERLFLTKYLFIIINIALFTTALTYLANAINNYLKEELTKTDYLLLGFITPYFFLNALIAGSELLSLTILIFFIAQIIKELNTTNKKISVAGIIFGLLFLARYTNFYFVIFLFITKKPIEIFKRFFWSFVIVFPWLLYNFIKTGNWFTSIVSSLANNILFRIELMQPINVSHLLQLLSITTIVAIIGLFLLFSKKHQIKKKMVIATMIIVVGLITFYSYKNTPLKSSRYLFNIIFPVAFFFSIAITRLSSKIKFKYANIAITILILIPNLLAMGYIEANEELYLNKIKYQDAADKIKELNLTHCSIRSEEWIFLDYFGVPGKNAYENNSIIKHMEQDEIVVSFNKKYNLPIIYESNQYTIYGTMPKEEFDCKSTFGLDETYLNYIRRIRYIENKIIINTDPCVTLFREHKFLQKVCNVTNFY